MSGLMILASISTTHTLWVLMLNGSKLLGPESFPWLWVKTGKSPKKSWSHSMDSSFQVGMAIIWIGDDKSFSLQLMLMIVVSYFQFGAPVWGLRAWQFGLHKKAPQLCSTFILTKLVCLCYLRLTQSLHHFMEVWDKLLTCSKTKLWHSTIT